MREDCEGEKTAKSWSLMKSQHITSKHVGNNGRWSKNSLDGGLLARSVFNEEKDKLNGHFGKKSNHFRKENKKYVKTRMREEVK